MGLLRQLDLMLPFIQFHPNYMIKKAFVRGIQAITFADLRIIIKPFHVYGKKETFQNAVFAVITLFHITVS